MEFNDSYRQVDVLKEVAFLCMDAGVQFFEKIIQKDGTEKSEKIFEINGILSPSIGKDLKINCILTF